MTSTSVEARQATANEELLGAFLKDPTLFPNYKAGLMPEHFGEYDWLYRIILETDTEEGLSFKGVVQRCDVSSIKILHELRSAYYSENRIPGLIRTLKKNLLRQTLLGISRQVVDAAVEDEDPDEMLRNLQKSVFELSTSESKDSSDPERDVEEWADYVMKLSKNPEMAFGLLTGMNTIDGMTTGWHKTDFSVVGARTSMGKTAFVIEMLLRLSRNGYKCAMFSLEMSKQQLYFRMMSNLMQVNFELFRTGRLAPNHYENMQKYKNELKKLYIDDTRAVSADYIADEMRRLKRTQGLDFVVVDYLQDVKEQGEINDNGGSALARVCRKLRAAAQECDCHVMGLSQVVRGVEDRKDKRPGNADLSGSTGIETSADVIALLYRDDYYDPNSDKPNILEVNFTKQRNGKCGKVELYYDRTTQRITELRRG
ncbi:DnaB-like helicase C-terminal domain-containing protein [Paenibacillus macerans]|uniref:replicative DNA helicase n=1 Tax=Paenibacillus macerans TaxID=44252 RepID=UPI001B1A34A9|nr:DnaB-like helicase C-terminal domain-containing protein [Paenibacillus macerans]MEC0140782.1 DnaB-like helicase C-terminal domain-containing protein [Paenibacillus macerans]GIP10440.1 replicative DNA helicase [Paenibacillus macerans]